MLALYVFLTTLGGRLLTPIDFGSYTLPFEPDDVFESSLSFLALFGGIMLITASLRYGPRVWRSMKSLMR